jgi:hypothetical protein
MAGVLAESAAAAFGSAVGSVRGMGSGSLLQPVTHARSSANARLAVTAKAEIFMGSSYHGPRAQKMRACRIDRAAPLRLR